jgi:predicted DNA-binding protein (UPF0251 family)
MTHVHPDLQPLDINDNRSTMASLAGAYRRFVSRGHQPLQNVTASNVTELNRTRPIKPNRTRLDIARQKHETIRLWRDTNLTIVDIALRLDIDRGTVSCWVYKAGLSRPNAVSTREAVA